MSKNGMLLVLALSLGGVHLCAAGEPAPSASPCPPVCCPSSGPSLLDRLAALFRRDCGPPACVQKECIRVVEVRQVPQVRYRCAEQDICKSACTPCTRLGRRCDPCAVDVCDRCGKVRTRRQLLKRIFSEEQCVTKCIPVSKPLDCAPAPAAPEGEKLPAEPIPAEPAKK